MKRRWLYILVAFAIAWLMAEALRSRGRVPSELEGLATQYDVEILRDEWGVPHILGERDSDAAFGLAYAHAEDDFPTIQGALTAARGRLATILGSDGGPNDYMVALLKVTEIAAEGYAAMDSSTRALCDAYADGLNVYAARHPDEAIGKLYPITGQDIVAGFVHKTPLFFGLDAVLAALFATADLGRDSTSAGSNAFALSSSKTADGSTMLAVNSHQPWTGPVAWYEAHLMSNEGLNVVGGTFPGAPVILHGHNEHLGWAHTVNKPDVIDTYELELHPDDASLYRLDGAWVEFERRKAGIPVRLVGVLEWTFDRDLEWSAHGPVVRTDEGVVAVRFPGWGDAGQIQQWYRMNRATNLDEWYDAMSAQSIPVFNTVYADAADNILYVYNARLPNRAPGQDWSGRLPGDRSDLIWTEYLPFEALPQVLNPASGYVQNANSTPLTAIGPMADGGEARNAAFANGPLANAGIETHETNRSMRALQLFESDSSVSWSEFVAYKYDTRFSADSRAADLIRQLRFASITDSLTAAARDVLTSWDLDANAENEKAALAVTTLQPFLSDYDESVPTADLVSSLETASLWLLDGYGTLTPRWGQVNRLHRGDVDIGLSGAPDVLHAIYGSRADDGHLEGYQGDSYVLLVQFVDGRVRSESAHVFGSATSRPESPHYSDQAQLFADRRLKEVLFYREDVLAGAARRYRP